MCTVFRVTSVRGAIPVQGSSSCQSIRYVRAGSRTAGQGLPGAADSVPGISAAPLPWCSRDLAQFIGRASAPAPELRGLPFVVGGTCEPCQARRGHHPAAPPTRRAPVTACTPVCRWPTGVRRCREAVFRPVDGRSTRRPRPRSCDAARGRRGHRGDGLGLGVLAVDTDDPEAFARSIRRLYPARDPLDATSGWAEQAAVPLWRRVGQAFRGIPVTHEPWFDVLVGRPRTRCGGSGSDPRGSWPAGIDTVRDPGPRRPQALAGEFRPAPGRGGSGWLAASITRR